MALLHAAGALVGAGGATAYYNGFDVTGAMRYMLSGGQVRDLSGWHAPSSNKEIDALYRMVRS
jgi:hypothetical protein